MDKSKLKLYLITATYSILLFLLLLNVKAVSGTLNNFLRLLTPFIYGFAIAYLLKEPYKFFYRLSDNKFIRDNKYLNKFRKPVALVSVYLCFFIGVIIIFSIIVPQLVESVNTFINNVDQYSRSLETFFTNLMNQFNIPYDLWGQLDTVWAQVEALSKSLLQTLGKFVTNGIPRVLNLAMNITSGVSNIIIGFVISIYILSSKEKLKTQAKKLIIAFLPEKRVKRIIEVAILSNKTFGGFIAGQLTDAFILGVLCFFGMSLLNFPYALLVSVIIGLTNIIPIFGPIIGAIPCTFIILMVNPMKAVWFIVFIIVLQQIDGNIICPRIVGNSIGLSGLWVMFAILVGGGMFGLIGMLIGVPTFAVIYALIKQATYARLTEKSNPISKK